MSAQGVSAWGGVFAGGGGEGVCPRGITNKSTHHKNISKLISIIAKRSCGKVMFSQACVKNSVRLGGGAFSVRI